MARWPRQLTAAATISEQGPWGGWIRRVWLGIAQKTAAVQKEVSLVADIDGDGKPEFIYARIESGHLQVAGVRARSPCHSHRASSHSWRRLRP